MTGRASSMSDNIIQDARSYRLTNIDFMRGLVIVIMALDHVRDNFLMGTVTEPLSQPDVPLSLYLTRWVTHFCAPVFIFLAGTSAGMMLARKTPRELGSFLFKRGVWLVFVEVVIISTAITFSPFGMEEMGGALLLVLQVIWAIGACMVLLSVAQFGGARFCLVLAAVILLGHNLLDPLWPAADLITGESSPLALLFYQGSFLVGPVFLPLIYPILSWFGLMLLGFGSASLFQLEATHRDALLLRIGLSFIAVFLILRATGFYGDPNPWMQQEHGVLATAMDFMNVTKYPPSLLYLLATLGPMAVLCAYADRIQGWFKDTLVMFGRVPFAFYVAHQFLIHALAVIAGMLQGFGASEFMTGYLWYPEGYGIGLPGVYLVWLLVIALLYPLCHWMAALKSRRKDWWLSYL